MYVLSTWQHRYTLGITLSTTHRGAIFHKTWCRPNDIVVIGRERWREGRDEDVRVTLACMWVDSFYEDTGVAMGRGVVEGT